MKPRFSSRYDWRVVAAQQGCGEIIAAVCRTQGLVGMCNLVWVAPVGVT
jgi:hypothetical protein